MSPVKSPVPVLRITVYSPTFQTGTSSFVLPKEIAPTPFLITSISLFCLVVSLVVSVVSITRVAPASDMVFPFPSRVSVPIRSLMVLFGALKVLVAVENAGIAK